MHETECPFCGQKTGGPGYLSDHLVTCSQSGITRGSTPGGGKEIRCWCGGKFLLLELFYCHLNQLGGVTAHYLKCALRTKEFRNG